jgi:uncharacterized protein
LAVVTGASKGIGFALARQFAEHGFDLVIAAASEELERAAETLRQLGARVETVRANLATADGCGELERIVDSFGKELDAVALNAGVGVGGRFAETDLGRELEMLNLNCAATVMLAKWAVQRMVPLRKGRILITSSIAGVMPSPFEAVYGATKAFDLSFAASLQHELKDSGVSVTALLPGPTETDFFHRAGLDGTKVEEMSHQNDPAEVAKQAFDALMAGEERVAAGNFSVKAQAWLARFTPESVKAAMHARLSEPGGATSEQERPKH